MADLGEKEMLTQEKWETMADLWFSASGQCHGFVKADKGNQLLLQIDVTLGSPSYKKVEMES